VNGSDSSAQLGSIATVLSHNFFGALQVAPRMVKLAALRLAIAKNVSKIARQDAALRFSLPFLSHAEHFSLLTARPSALDSRLCLRYTQECCSYADFFEGIGAGQDAQTHIST
jgi:hypothetical protein